MACWRVSRDQYFEAPLVHCLYKPVRQTQEPIHVPIGSFIVARLARNRYVAQVTDYYEEEGEIDVSLLMPRLVAKEYSWPNDMKTATVPLSFILCEVNLMEQEGKFSFSPADMEKLISLKIIRK